jgi:hypothetical protein
MEIWAVTAAGELRRALVTSTEPVSIPVSLVRVLTRAGDVLAPSSSQLAGAQGPVLAEDIRPGPRSLELVAPVDLPRAQGHPAPLEGLAGFVAVVPEEAADVATIERALQRANVSHSISVRGGWVAVEIRACEKTPLAWSWTDELEVLLALTAWAPEDGVPIHRTRIQDRLLRARLAGTLLACGRNFELRWVPAYQPVEARVMLTDSTPAFTGVVAVHEMTGEAIDVVVKDATAAVVDLAYLRLRRLAD